MIQLDGTTKSLEAALNTLEIYGSISGLKVNTEKTHIAWIGKKKHSKDKIYSQNHTWETVTEFKLLGIYFSVDLGRCMEANYDNKKSEIRQTINQWNKRFLTPLGKVTVIKTFLMSKVNHLFTALPNPKESYLNEITNMFYQFLWSGKPDKINRKTVELDYSHGGIKMLNLRNSITALKATWFRRLFLDQSLDQPLWIVLFEKIYNTNVTKICNFGIHYPEILKKRSRNLFWKDVFDAWIQISNKQNYKNSRDVLVSPLWYNHKMSYREMYIPKWYQRGIVTISDIIDTTGTVMDIDTIKSVYNIDIINPLHYLRVKQNVKEFLKEYGIQPDTRVQRPFVPLYMKILLQSNKGASIFNSMLKKENKNDHSVKQKWQMDLNVIVDDNMWKNIFNSCFKSVSNNILIWFQLKLIYRILGTKSYLHKVQLSDTDTCAMCGEKETIIHMFVECTYVKIIWSVIEKYIKQQININVTFSILDILFGYCFNNQNKIPIDAIILITKKYIFDIKFRSSANFHFNFDVLKYKFSQTYKDEKYSATLNNGQKKFDAVWTNWKSVFCSQSVII